MRTLLYTSLIFIGYFPQYLNYLGYRVTCIFSIFIKIEMIENDSNFMSDLY